LMHLMLEDQEKNEMDDEHLAYLAGNLVCSHLTPAESSVRLLTLHRWKLVQILLHLHYFRFFWP
jgi:hypothetical protein